jgi:hypothetical protein
MEITQQELIELTQCDDLYRNTNDILTDDHIIIEKGYLWKANGHEVTLIDDVMLVRNSINYF